MSPNDKNFFAVASAMLSELSNALPPKHQLTLIVRHETDESSGMVLTSEQSEKPETIELLHAAIKRGLSQKPAYVVEVAEVKKPNPRSN